MDEPGSQFASGDVSNRKPFVRVQNNQNAVVQPLLTDLYQITMAYAYWKSGRVKDVAVFDLFFRQNPFQGEFTIFAGLEECLKFLQNFHYSDSDISYLRSTLPSSIEEEFYVFLQELNACNVVVNAIEEGSVTFPRVPLMRVEGPLIVVQLLETTLLTLVNFASLMTTNAARYRLAAGKKVRLLEFGLRRAQGPDGGLSASKYAYIGGFDGTSNVLAGKMYNIPVKGTHAHAYITSFSNFNDLQTRMLVDRNTGEERDLLQLATKWRVQLSELLDIMPDEVSDGELAALISFAIAFPDGFIALVDTYDVKSVISYRSGLINFCSVAMALNDLGYRAIGIRIDSGDLAYLSNKAREVFIKISHQYYLSWFADLQIMASNDINEDTILSLNDQNHKIDCFAIGTHLVTCQRQPALGCVYKLVEINGIPRIKLSQDVAKVTMPGRKDAYRLYGTDGHALIDLLQRSVESPPEVGVRVLCRHPFQESKRAYVIPTRVEPLYKEYWSNGKIRTPLPTLGEVRQRVQTSLQTLRQDHKRNLNPTPYKVQWFRSFRNGERRIKDQPLCGRPNMLKSDNLLVALEDEDKLTAAGLSERFQVAVSDDLYSFIHDLWLQNAPIGELS
ncbi:nicotinate phosphoribosyltransferase isoform X2 [Cimex lectularius]|uniref:Nicotinate phosphoribosyltransferase n=1 Tax=Cimex lectularius TaxID=79782 RepID=A0A8I6SVN7_CIMLE|nr:nicotinate phosphoribosyltransferase isoform X2 [Cimex lectularius]